MFDDLVIGNRYTRPTLGDYWGIDWHGFSKGVFTPRGSRKVILFVTRIKQDSLTQYKDFISGGLVFWEGEIGKRNDARIRAAAQNGEEVHLFYREIHHSPFEYMGQIKLHNVVEVANAPNQFIFCLQNDQGVTDDLNRFSTEISQIPDATEREQVVRSRVGQGRFRESLIRYWNGECAITGANRPTLLTASHIRPWRSSSHAQRLDTYNGLLLLTLYDRLFDSGLISFDNDGLVMVSNAFPKQLWQRSGISGEARISRLDDRHKAYLSYHRNYRFVRASED